jgi:hypothetical protein
MTAGQLSIEAIMAVWPKPQAPGRSPIGQGKGDAEGFEGS